ncbi:MAG TPA: CDP-alcohol phosphatidyltransferase family protein [Blastocatellia bacterium]|nr:CDP-alcohol phosphatidyltransferase family protein [Blastocatellia bacterium]
MINTAVANSLTQKSVLNPEFKSADRQQTSLLAPLERVCLGWLARNMPRWVKPDHLTLLGLAAMLIAGASYACARWSPVAALLVVNLCLAINWFGDSLDGTLARARNKQRPRYGFYVDHIIDAFGIMFTLCGLALSGLMSWNIALGVLVVYFMLSIDVYLATYTIGTFRISFYKFSPTELRILLAIGNLRAMSHPSTRIFGDRYLFFDIGAVVAIVLMAVVLLISVTRNTVTLYRAEKV